MKALIPTVLLIIVSMVFGSLTYSQDAGGSVLQWDPIESTFDSLIIRCSDTAYDTDDPDWGVAVATVHSDSTGEFPVSVQLPAAFVVDPEKCIACGICISQCPVNAITEDTDGKAVINPDLCIACGICTSSCPVSAIFAPSPDLQYAVFGVNEEGLEVFIQGSDQ